MDPLDLKTNEELLFFFSRKKAEISCIEQPHRLLTQLSDHDLVPEKLFENVKKMRTHKQKEKGFYEVLDWLEKNRPQDIKQFWRCVFEDNILKLYPTLRMLRNSLLDSSIKLHEKPLDVQTATEEEESEGKAEKQKEKNYKRKRSKDDRNSEDSDDPDLFSVFTPNRKKPAKKPSSSSKTNFTLVEKRDAEDFQEQGRKGGGTEIRGRVEEEEEEEEDMADLSVFQAPSLPVTCVSLTGTLYKYRFASGKHGKCIRTEERWFTPEEFVKQEPNLTDGNWKKDILCHGKMLNFLLKKEILHSHSLLCECVKCSIQKEDEMAQNNDDECYVCRSEGHLVCCDECPRAFHSHCHLPAVHGDSSGEWICTFCVLKNSQQWHDSSNMSEQEAFNAPVSQYILHCHCLLLCVYRKDIQKVFVEDPRKTVRRYSEFITQPMWLDKIKQKLESGTYQTVGAFVSDFQLIFSNCSTFNKDNEFVRMGARLKKSFEEEFQKIFSISIQ